MELRHLKYFLTLSEELHFGKAAEKLFISQPPLSRLIKSLEEELDVPLFDRNNRKVKLTTYGEYLQSETSKILSHIDMIKNHLKLLKRGTVNPVRIGYIASVMFYFLPGVLDRLKTKHPQVNTFLVELDDASQVKALKSGEIDIGFLRAPINDKELVYEHIYDEPFTLILSSKHKLASKKNVILKDLAADPFITFSRSCSIMRGINSILKKNGILPKTAHQTSQINTMLRLVESNVGYAIVPSTVLKGYDLKVKRFELTEYNERTPIYIAYKQMNQTDIIKEFVGMIKEYTI